MTDDQSLRNAFLFRQPILNRQQELAGYQLSFRSSADDHRQWPRCYGRAVCGLFRTGHAECAWQPLRVHRYRCRLSAPGGHRAAAAGQRGPRTVARRRPDKATLTRCQSLRDRGYALALTDYRGIDDRSRPVLPMVEVIKIDLDTAEAGQLRDLAGSLRKLPLKLLAQGVASREQMEHAVATSASSYFQGRYFAQAEIVSGRRLSASQAALIRLINLVGRDVDTIVIEDAFKHEPALTLNLLRVVNSVGHRGGRPRAAGDLAATRDHPVRQAPVAALAVAASAGTAWRRRPTPPAHHCCRWPPCVGE
jgi:EAL and modified HD-GYP domain-containing signal transduction protein